MSITWEEDATAHRKTYRGSTGECRAVVTVFSHCVGWAVGRRLDHGSGGLAELARGYLPTSIYGRLLPPAAEAIAQAKLACEHVLRDSPQDPT